MKYTQYDPISPNDMNAQVRNPADRLGDGDRVRKPLLECELQDLNGVVADLQESVDRLRKHLAPVSLPKDMAPEVPQPPQPKVNLPPLGEALRDLRWRVEAAVSDLRSIRDGLEI